MCQIAARHRLMQLFDEVTEHSASVQICRQLSGRMKQFLAKEGKVRPTIHEPILRRRLYLPDLRIRQVEVVFPMRAVARFLPAAPDGPAVGTPHAHEALPETRSFPPHLPDAIEEAHLVDAGDSTRVEVEHAIRLGRLITTQIRPWDFVRL
ncbi:MAG: hypothetical protein ACJ788_06010 [Ktedonobacteraceae bacterium]